MFACLHTSGPAPANPSLYDIALRFSPRVQEITPNTVVLDLDGLKALFKTPQQFANRLRTEASTLLLNIRVAVASNPDAAIHAARGFAGITVIAPGREAERLRSLPLDLLDLSDELRETLDRWGLRTFGDLARLDVTAVTERLGKEGARLHRMARGEFVHAMFSSAMPERFEETLDLDDPIGLLEPLSFILDRLLNQLFARLTAAALGASEVRLRLALENSKTYEKTLHLPLPVRNSKLLLKLIQLDLRAHPPGAPIVKVTVEAKPAKPRTAQNGLFVPVFPEPEKLELTLAKISGIVGEGNAGSPEIRDTHRPDAFTLRHALSLTRRFAPPSPGGRGLEAVRLFRPPLPASIETRSGKPARISYDGMFGDVIAAAGPWKTSGDWWREDGWDREEWDVEIRCALRVAGCASVICRVYQDFREGCWFVEGIYD